MDIHTATEESYKNGYEKGYADGMAEAVKTGLAKGIAGTNEELVALLKNIASNISRTTKDITDIRNEIMYHRW